MALSIGTAIALLPQAAQSQFIDFEATPAGGMPTDNLALGLSEAYIHGDIEITFGFDVDGDGTPETTATFEQYGPQSGGESIPNYGFTGSEGQDTADAGYGTQLGGFFLRSPNHDDYGTFVISYAGTGVATSVSGEIWDVDGSGVMETEQFLLTAVDKTGTQTIILQSPLGIGHGDSTFDGKPWEFQFSGMTAGVARIKIEFTGLKTSNVGLAFNNFDATGAGLPKPLPAIGHAKLFILVSSILAIGLLVIHTRRSAERTGGRPG